MFQAVELNRKVSKDDYKKRVPDLRTRLLALQQRLKSANFSVVIVFAGVDGSGKSESINRLCEWLDPRFLQTQAFDQIPEAARLRPPFWRYWNALPPHGSIGLYMGSWYEQPIADRATEKISDSNLQDAAARISLFENALSDDGTLILKFWLHISEEKHAKRLSKLEKNPEQSWRVTDRARRQLKNHKRILEATESMISLTSTGEAPWTLVEATDRRHRELFVAEQIASRLERALNRKSPPASISPPAAVTNDASTVLEGKQIDKQEYEEKLSAYQSRLAQASRKFKEKGLSTLLAFEGWDAAGKGGTIRRLTAAMDARYYSVQPIAAPTDEERKHHYLWRFWRRLPEAGKVTIFDRTWYGRLLVERVEGFASERQWSRAFKEINDFERHLTNHGMVLKKFWLHIDQEEQLRRFEERERTPWKKFKITDEDWRNREKWPLYERAVHDLVEKTSTSYARWDLVPANDKKYARIVVLKSVVEAMEERL